MGKPISSVGGISSPTIDQSTSPTSGSGPAQSDVPTKSPEQSSPSPVQTEPQKFWPPAYGWRLSALEGQRQSHNGWQSKWLEHGSAIAGGGAVDSVAALKPVLDPHLVKPNGTPFKR